MCFEGEERGSGKHRLHLILPILFFLESLSKHHEKQEDAAPDICETGTMCICVCIPRRQLACHIEVALVPPDNDPRLRRKQEP